VSLSRPVNLQKGRSPLPFRSVQLAKVRDQCFKVIRLQVHRCHPTVGQLAVEGVKERNELSVRIFLTTPVRGPEAAVPMPPSPWQELHDPARKRAA
jgi:hypothetical protein